MKKQKTVLLTIIAVAALLLLIVGATFAYFSAIITETDKTETKLQSAKLGIVFDGTQEIEATSIEPGWSASKKFTVENTSDYDMTYDVNFTKVVNNFTRTSDLYAVGSATFVDSNHFNDTVQMVDLNATTVNSAKSNFALPTSTGQEAGRYTLPVDGTVDDSTTPATITYGTNVYKVAKVFIPAHSKQEITLVFNYKYLAPTAGYTLGDPEDPNNQNADQGKIFRTTISIVANGIDNGSTQSNNTNEHSGSTTNGEYPTNDNGNNNNQGQQISYWTPTYFTIQSSDTFPPDPSEVTTDYMSIIADGTFSNDNVVTFKAYDDNNNTGVCVLTKGDLACFKENNYEVESQHIQEFFASGIAEVNNDNTYGFKELDDGYNVQCNIYEAGDVYCSVVHPQGWQFSCGSHRGNGGDYWGQCNW